MNKETFNAKVTHDGHRKRERIKKNLIREINRKSIESLSYQDVLINGIAANLTIDSGTMANKKNISSKCGESFNVGDIVTYCRTPWLIMKADVNDEIYVRGQMQQCNYRLRFQNKNREIVEYDCVIESASQYNSGEEAYKTITIGYNQNLIYIPLNEDTLYFKSEDRFFIDNNRVSPKVYRSTRVDTVTNAFNGKGFVTVLVTEDQYNAETDNIEMFICDYKEPHSDTDDITITYRNDATIVCGGSYKTFTADRDVTWNIDCLPEILPFIKTEVSSNKIKVKCLNNLSLIGTTINLTCVDNDGNTGQLYIDITSSV